jgi:serine/threonine protein kinase
MELKPGAKLGPYEILARIGAGGMGQVWKARDTRLDRLVAIKVSQEQFSERFEREARAISSLNHPHICTLYDVGPDYLVMEYLEGQPLQGPLPLDAALRLALQTAEALDAAHRKGIVHRDLKPANILITKSGIKVLDFGLAKIEPTKDAVVNDATLSQALTQQGSIVGTLQYMAPEQLQGKAADARADIFSFGCVLYEMLTGKRAFEGANSAIVMAAILEREPPSLAEVAPPALDWALRRCLAKDPEERWQSARDLRAALERVSHSGTEVTSELKPSPSKRRWMAAAVTLAAILAAVIVSVTYFRQKPPETTVMRLSIAPPERNRFGRFTSPAVSPDGRHVVFAATSDDGKDQLWLRPLDSLTAQPLEGTENAIYPFWSPDNKSIGFFAAGKLKRMNVSGGPATTLAEASTGRGGTWSPDGVIVFAPAIYSGLYQVAASGSEVRRATRFDPGTPPKKFPWFLPDGRHFLYLFGAGGRDRQTIQIGSLDSPEEDRTLLSSADGAAMYAQGHVLLVRGTTLVARPFDAKRLAFTGEEVPVAEHLLIRGPLQSWVFSVSSNGVLAYESGGVSARQLTWLDRAGKRLGTVGDPGDLGAVQLSPDRRTAAVHVYDASSANTDIWLYDVLRGLRTRFTFSPAPEGAPVWSPDGRVIVFRSNRTGRFDLYRKPADGSRNEELLYADNLLKGPTSFSPDGTYLAYEVAGDPKTGGDIWILPDPLGAPGASKPYPFLRTEFNEQDPQFSPDGHWIAYESNESGRYEVYVVPFPGPGGKRQVSTAGGTGPRWRADGKELFYGAADKRLMAAEVDAKGGAFEVKKVEPLFGPIFGGERYDVSADGQRFLTLVPVGGETDTTLTVVQNWTTGIKSGK